MNRDIQALYDAIGDIDGDEEVENQGVKKDVMKKLKVITIKSKKQYAKDDVCSICLSNYGYGQKIIKLPCKHDFHKD